MSDAEVLPELTPERAMELARDIDGQLSGDSGAVLGCYDAADTVRALELLAEQMPVVGPKMPCGLYAVEHQEMVVPPGSRPRDHYVPCWYGVTQFSRHSVTPEYREWRSNARRR